MKRIIQIFIAILFAMPVVSQTVEIVDVPAALPGEVNVTIRINGTLSQVGSLTLKIDLDNDMLIYQTGQHTTTYPGTFLIAENNSVLTVAWFTDDILGDGTNITGDFVTLKFNYTGGFNAALDFISNCEIEDIEGVTLLSFINNPGSFINGSIVPDLTNPNGKASIGTNTAIAGADVSVPLTIADDGGFIGEVSAINLKVGFDTSKLTFINLTNNTLGLTAEASNGVITISKFNLSPPLTAFPYTVDMNFTYNGGGLADLTFLPGSVINGLQGQGLITLFEAGWVNVDLTNAGKLTIAKVSSPEGYWEPNPFPPYGQQFVPQPVLVPVTANNFTENVGAIELVIAFDEEKLDFTGYTNGPLGTGWNVTQSDGLLHFQRIGVTGITLPDNIALFTLKFDYSNGVADITFAPNTILYRPNGTFIPVDLINGYVTPFIGANVKVFLEGPWNGTTMNTTLLGLGLIPLEQPYDVAPWNYAGTESLESVLDFPADVVDWVLVELRDKDDNTLVVGKRAGFLLAGGNIVDLDGTSPLSFGGGLMPDVAYYIVVRHRNHIDVMSATAVLLTSTSAMYNFTDAISKASNGANGYKELPISTGVFGMVTSDIIHDGDIYTGDYDKWVEDFGFSGYYNSDVDMDGEVLTSDYDKWVENFGYSNPILSPFIEPVIPHKLDSMNKDLPHQLKTINFK